ncbi:uncharacterized protein Tco025E_04122 [Trypanosoma conorhini]|uniref:Uncharacterized protein n=1 Tax=Trypanosoma conorhini TaxID=83891 RepID=A0A3R7NBC7_9TRYP|nr:uncharacterized protein Tco025E_04122 [Trypanosoma conorhini]RNF19499.1 hypothetical protein Tco025E_04122 [Trypanosoma conorhini]
MAKGKKKGPVDVFATVSPSTSVRGAAAAIEPAEVTSAELLDTTLVITPAIPRVEVSLNIQFRCSVPLVEGDTLQLQLPGFRGKASLFTTESSLMQTMVASPRHFRAYWTGEGEKKGKGHGKQQLLLRCVRRVETQQLVLIVIPRSLGLISPDKLAQNSSKIKISGQVKHADGGKILKQVFASTTEVKKRPVAEEIKEYKTLMAGLDQAGGLEEADAHVAEELSLEEVDNIWESAHDRCPYPIALQWHIAVSVFREYEDFGSLLKTIVEGAIASVKRRQQPLALYREIAKNLGVKVGAVILFQDVVSMLYASLYPALPGTVLLALRLFTMEPIDVARTFLTSEPPALSLAHEIYSSFRTGDTEGLKKWSNTLATLLLIVGTHAASQEQHADAPPLPVLYYGIKEVPQDELRYLREMPENEWYMFPFLALARPDVDWTDEEAFPVPDNAVLFEIHHAVDGLDVSDLSMYPYDREWLLPLFSSFRVTEVKVYEDRNGLTHVVLDMQGCLHGSVKDPLIPEEDRAVAAMMVKKLRSEAEKLTYRARFIAEHAYLHVSLNQRLRLQPQTLLQAQYVDHYFEVKRFSEAKLAVEEGIVNWQVCTSPAQLMDPVEGVIKHAVWESMPRKFALLAEQYFLSRTRFKKVFEVHGIFLDFAGYVCDYAGKGPRPMRRLLRKRVTHEAPLPVFEELQK